MKLLHTADWHLGKKLEQSERTDEHQDFLNWLISTLIKESIDVLVIAGDIFDTGIPPNTALALYYRFLRQVKNTGCHDVIIIGGNHDSIMTLEAPKELLHYFNVHIIGGVPEIFSDQIIVINDSQGEPELVVCAVPFLRDRDIRLSIAGESHAERESRIKQGIEAHYHNFIPYLKGYKAAGIPVIATGHLFAAGSSTSESEKEIHVGNLGQVKGDQFPAEFDYVALGHIHRPQVINQMQHIRYSGSPIPLSFSENDDRKQVLILEFNPRQFLKISTHEVPCTRKLIRIKGDLETVKSKLRLLQDPGLKYPAWIEVQVMTDKTIIDLEEQLAEIKLKLPFIEQLFIRQLKIRPTGNLDQLAGEATILSDLTPREVFLKRCEAEPGEDDYTELIALFEEALENMGQKLE